MICGPEEAWFERFSCAGTVSSLGSLLHCHPLLQDATYQLPALAEYVCRD